MDLDFRDALTGLTEVEDNANDGVLAIRFIIGLDFAVTRVLLLNLVEIASPLQQSKQ